MDTRNSIIDHAFDELSEVGLQGFSLRAVGSAAGLSATAVYRHFKSKEDLLFVVGEEAFEAFRQRVLKIPDAPLGKWLRHLTRTYASFALDDPGRFDACFILRTRVERIYPADFCAGKSPVISIAAQRIQAADRKGVIGAERAVELALFMWAQVHGLVMLYRAGRFSLEREAFLKLCERGSEPFSAAASSSVSESRSGVRRVATGAAR